ncbi:HsdM family class I SAM-dependent methyltransferase [Haladaptatus cibarius]|uniref:HsdM family class I SAM-dependent methyltransferase n=1 Tax=Haladaptatus cibarius TaxID=453847 RepID=UPI0006798D09|nr:N-6 DNA methylase [Haladaptatus cibarius]
MPSKSSFHARLCSAIEQHVSTHDTHFETPGREKEPNDATGIFVPSTSRDGIPIEITDKTVDPHSVDVRRRGDRYARKNGASLFVTANEHDAFLFRRTESATDGVESTTDETEFARRHYDLRTQSVEEFVGKFIADVVELQDGSEVSTTFDDIVVLRLRSFHTSIFPLYESLIREKFDDCDRFRELLVEWARKNDYPFEFPDLNQTFRIAAQQYAYLLLNRTVFAELGRAAEFGDNRAPDVSMQSLDQRVSGCVQSAGGEHGFDPLFETDSEFFAAIPNDDRTRERLFDFINSIEEEPFSAIDTDVVGQLYQQLIPVEERKTLGQFYTPDAIGRLLSRWAIRSPDDRFLDPASGSGAIAIEAYKRLDELGTLSHQEILRRITAVDINEFPLHLTALNLATRNVREPTTERFAYHADFFDLEPGASRSNTVERGRGATENEEEPTAGDPIGTFDATVANPPYVRQEFLYPNRDHFRDHLKRFEPDSARNYSDGERAIDGRSDLYCYFLTNVTRFLREGARLAWVIPTKWMSADYGPSLRRFLYDQYKVEAVVGFRNRLFEDALVDTVLLLMERTDDATARRNTQTKFIRLNERMDEDDVLALIDRTEDVPDGSYMTIRGDSAYRTITISQSYLANYPEAKLQQYITAPTLYTAVLEHDNTVSLSDVATITRGKKTGANPIFILDAETTRARTIDDRFLRPAVKSVKEVDGYEQTATEAEQWMLDMSEYVSAVESDIEATAESAGETTNDLAENVVSALQRDGYDGVLSYLRWAETHPARSNKSVNLNDPWFDMGSLDDNTAPIVCPQAMDTHRFFARTDEKIVASNRFLLVRPTTVDSTLLLGLLNASLSKIVIESHGRVTGGGAINLSSSDLRTLRVVDPDSLTDEQKETVRNGFETLAGGDERGRDDIDNVVASALDFDLDNGEIREIARTLKSTRRKKGQEVAALIRNVDELESGIEVAFGDTRGRNE